MTVRLRRLNGIKQYATGTGAGALTLAAVFASSFRTMQTAGMLDTDLAYVRIEHETIPSEWQIVRIAYATGGTITPTFDSLSSSATGSLINFSAGNKIVSLPPMAADIKPWRIITSGSSTAMDADDYELIINKTVSGAHAVTLPANPVVGQTVLVSDGNGDAGTYNITVSAASGTISGAANHVIRANYAGAKFRFNGTEWNTVY